MKLSSQLAGTGHDANRWLVLLFLAVGVLAPAACVLWFMNEAMTNQRDAAHQKLSEAYRGQLQLMRDNLDADWAKRAADLDREVTSNSPPVAFEHCVRSGLADAVICVDPDGRVAYPAMPAPLPADALETRPDWLAAKSLESQYFFTGAADSFLAIGTRDSDVNVAARALQAHIRCLLRSNAKSQALQVIEQSFTAGRLMTGKDPSGLIIAVDEQLLALTLFAPDDPARGIAARRLHDLLSDYRNPAIAGAQRLFAMDEVHSLNLGPAISDFATRDGERLAEQFIELRRGHAGSGVLEPSGLPDVWKLSTPGGRILALYRTATVRDRMKHLMAGNRGFDVAAPAASVSGDWTSISGRFPGWRITDPSALASGDTARLRPARYVWIALLAIAVVAAAALAAAQSLRRQWKLARLKTDMVAAVSHELKTPLASVRLLVETLLEDEQPEGRTREYLELIAHENLRLSRLIGNFLTFSRLERNLRKFDFRPTPPRRVVEAAVESAQERLQTPDCQFAVKVAADLPEIRADEEALVTVLLNLLDNAYKYSPGEKQIELRAAFRDGHVVFSVEDHGIGIPPRERKRIFHRFYQVDRRLARESGGVGLGLSIVDFIVRAHGAQVEVESQPGKGSTFSVVMP